MALRAALQMLPTAQGAKSVPGGLVDTARTSFVTDFACLINICSVSSFCSFFDKKFKQLLTTSSSANNKVVSAVTCFQIYIQHSHPDKLDWLCNSCPESPYWLQWESDGMVIKLMKIFIVTKLSKESLRAWATRLHTASGIFLVETHSTETLAHPTHGTRITAVTVLYAWSCYTRSWN